jgi:hypothetical protein
MTHGCRFELAESLHAQVRYSGRSGIVFVYCDDIRLPFGTCRVENHIAGRIGANCGLGHVASIIFKDSPPVQAPEGRPGLDKSLPCDGGCDNPPPLKTLATVPAGQTVDGGQMTPNVRVLQTESSGRIPALATRAR